MAKNPAPPLHQRTTAAELHSPALPLGALMLATSMASWAQSSEPPSATLPAVMVRETVQIQDKDTLRAKKTTIGKGQQELRDIPQSVTVFTERLMDDRNQDDFREVLRTTSGVTFQAGETGEEDVRLRGFSLGQAGDIYIDGMKDAPLYERDTFNNDRVEVLKGSASMLFGKGSTGGVVNQVNKAPLLMDQHEATYTIGTGSEHRITGDFNFKTGEDAALRVNAMVHNADNHGATQKKRGIAPTFSWGIGTRDEFSVGLYYLDIQGRPSYNHPWFLDNGVIVPSLPAKNYYGLNSDYLNTSAKYVTLSHIRRFDNHGELSTRLRHGTYERDLWASVIRFGTGTTLENINSSTVVTRTPKGRVGSSDLTQLQSDYTHTFDWLGKKHALIAGLDIYHDDAERNQNSAGTASGLDTTVGTPNNGAWRPDTRVTPAYNRFTARNISLYAQDTMSLTSEFKLVAGLRYDHFKASYHTSADLNHARADGLWSPRVGALYQPNDWASYYVSYGTSYNTSGDTYQFGTPNEGTAKTASTPAEKSRNVEMGGKFELFDKRASLGVAAFYSEKYNERNTDPDTASAQQLLSGKRHAAGIEFNLAGRVTPRWEVFYNHTWIPSAKIDKSNVAATTCNAQGMCSANNAQQQGDRPGLTPKHSGSFWTTYAITPQWRVGAGLNYRGQQHPEGARAVLADSFVTADAMVEYSLNEKTSLKLNITNLSDERYADSLYRGFYAPGAARAVQLTFKTRF